MTLRYTSNYRFPVPDFRSPDWAPAIQASLDAIDTALRNVSTQPILWAEDVEFEIGNVAIDTGTAPVSYWICNVNHAAAGANFVAARAAHPTYWSAFSFGINPTGAWINNNSYNINDIAYDSVRGITGICNTAHISNAAGSIIDDSIYWDFIVNLPTTFTALATLFDNSHTALATNNVQGAIDLIFDNVAGAYVSNNITYDHAISGLAANNVKAALDEIDATVDSHAISIAANAAAIASGTISTGFWQWRPTSQILAGWTIQNGTTIGDASSGASQRANADTAAQFSHLWDNFSNSECPVSGGRGANAAADYAAHKTIQTVDMRGTFGGLGVDTMGGSASTRLTGATVVSGSTTAVASVLGETTHVNTLSELPTGITSTASPSLTANVTGSEWQAGSSTDSTGVNPGGSGGAGLACSLTGGSIAKKTAAGTATGTVSSTSNNTSGAAHNNVPRSKTGYWYMKL